MAEIINRSYYDAAEKGRQDRQQYDANALRQQALQQDVSQGEYTNSLMRNPTTTPEQFARAGRSDISNSLVGIQRGQQNDKADQAKQFAEQVVTASRYVGQIPPGQKKAYIEKNFPFLVQTYGPEWATASEEQVNGELSGISAKFGTQIGVGPAPKPKQYTTKPGPRGSIIQVDPETGEEKQVVGPDNSQPASGAAGGATPRQTFKDTQGLRKEFDSQQAVKDYKLTVPLYRRAVSAPNTRAGDLSVIYALGKMFDPGSVVREGELVMAGNTAPWLSNLVSKANSQLSGDGALSPETRKAITEALSGQLNSLKQSYSLERDRFSGYANDNGWAPGSVVGPDPGVDINAPAAGGGGGGAPPTYASEADAAAANIKPGTRVIINGVSGTWQ